MPKPYSIELSRKVRGRPLTDIEQASVLIDLVQRELNLPLRLTLEVVQDLLGWPQERIDNAVAAAEAGGYITRGIEVAEEIPMVGIPPGAN